MQLPVLAYCFHKQLSADSTKQFDMVGSGFTRKCLYMKEKLDYSQRRFVEFRALFKGKRAALFIQLAWNGLPLIDCGMNKCSYKSNILIFVSTTGSNNEAAGVS